MIWWLLACSTTAPPQNTEKVREPPSPPLLSVAPKTAQLTTYTEMWTDEQQMAHPSDGAGTATLLSTSTLIAGESGTLTAEFTVSEHQIANNGGLYFAPEPFWGWSAPQTHSAEQPGYVHFEGPNNTILQPHSGGGWAWATFNRPLKAGEKVKITYTGIVDRYAGTSSVWFGVDGDGDGFRRPVSNTPTVEVLPAVSVAAHLVLPSASEPNEPVSLRVSALDQFGNATTTGERVVTLRSPTLALNRKITLKEGQLFALVPLTSSVGVHTVLAEHQGQITTSNPMVVREGIPTLDWGDLQIHTQVSDGSSSPLQVLTYARDVAGLQVAILTDHDHWGRLFLDKNPSTYLEAAQTALSSRTEEFLPLVGYEWTSWVFGHRHIIDFGGQPPLASSLDEEADTPEELTRWVAGPNRFVIAHHIAGGPIAAEVPLFLNEQLEIAVEVESVHGQSVMPGDGQVQNAAADHFAVDWLNKGHKVAFLGSTDGHDGHPGLSHWGGANGGLTGFPGVVSTPQGYADAISKRRVYATNGRRIVLRAELDGQPIGSDIPSDGPWEIQVRIVGTAEVSGVTLWGPNGVVEQATPKALLSHHQWTVPRADWYFLQVDQVDGGRAWSSPWYAGEQAF